MTVQQTDLYSYENNITIAQPRFSLDARTSNKLHAALLGEFIAKWVELLC